MLTYSYFYFSCLSLPSTSFYMFFFRKKNYMEMRGIDPLAPRMRSECSTIWATSPLLLILHASFCPVPFSTTYILFRKNASGGVRTHASLDSRSWDGPLRPLGHECFSILLLYTLSCALTLFPFLNKMHPVGFEPTHLSIAELKSAPLDHSGTNASCYLLLCF